VMYLDDRIADDEPLSLSHALRASLMVSLVLIIFIGVYPQPFIALAQKLMPAQAAVIVTPPPSDNPPPSQ